jgi:hypothetical protein
MNKTSLKAKAMAMGLEAKASKFGLEDYITDSNNC